MMGPLCRIETTQKYIWKISQPFWNDANTDITYHSSLSYSADIALDFLIQIFSPWSSDIGVKF